MQGLAASGQKLQYILILNMQSMSHLQANVDDDQCMYSPYISVDH